MSELTGYLAKVSDETHQAVRSWFRLEKRVERARLELEAVTKEYETAKCSLGTYLCPNNPPPEVGEKFNIWYGSGMLEVEYVTNSSVGPRYNIGWRQQPHVKQLSDMA